MESVCNRHSRVPTATISVASRQQAGSNSSSDTSTDACFKCGELFHERELLNAHIKQCHDSFNTNRKECRYFRRGNCSKGDNCLFVHRRSRPMHCKNGVSCTYYARGKCNFYHEYESRDRNSHYVQFQGDQRGVRFCRFAHDCWRKPNCLFLHYDVDFPELTRRRTPHISVRHQQGRRTNVSRF